MSLSGMLCKFIFESFLFLFMYDQTLYDRSNLTVVFNDDDAIQEYEKQALAKSENLDADKLLANSLQKLDHVKKLEVLHGKEKNFAN